MEFSLESIQSKIKCVCQKSDRDPSKVKILAAIKDQSDKDIESLMNIGVRCFGENRFQQVLDRKISWQASSQYHFIGALQSNKIRKIIDIFDCIQSLDKMEHALKINSIGLEYKRTIPCFLQVNIGEEPQKRGVCPSELIGFVNEVMSSLTYISIQGLMCIAPHFQDVERVRPFFARMAKLNKEIAQNWPDQYDAQLSMGMSRDFQVAIEEGSTMIRLGKALFGEKSRMKYGK